MDRPYVKKEITDAIMDFWLNRCAFCGSSEVDRNHIELFAEGGSSDDPSNYILLCKNHHSLYHRVAPNGLPYLNKFDIDDVSTKKIINKNKHTSSLAIDPFKTYRFRMGSFAFIGTEEILVLGQRPIIELYRVKPTSKATREQCFLSVRFFNKKGEWIGSIIRNMWCGVRDVETNVEFIDIDKGMRITLPSQGINFEIKVDESEIILNGQFWWKSKRVEISESAFTVDGQVSIERGVFEGSLIGLMIDQKNDLYFGPQFKISQGGRLDVGPMLVFYFPWGVVSPVFLEKGMPLDITHGGGSFTEKKFGISLSPIKFVDELNYVRSWFKDSSELKPYNIPNINTEKLFRKFGDQHDVYVIKQNRKNIGMIYFRDIGKSPKRSEVRLYITRKDLKIKFFSVVLDYIKELSRGLYKFKYIYINIPKINMHLIKACISADYKVMGEDKNIISLCYDNPNIK